MLPVLLDQFQHFSQLYIDVSLVSYQYYWSNFNIFPVIYWRFLGKLPVLLDELQHFHQLYIDVSLVSYQYYWSHFNFFPSYILTFPW